MQIKSMLSFIGQLFILWLINEISYLIVDSLRLPIPGNVLGMIILFILLLTGVVKLKWIDRAASFLLKHLVFFFIPITVGIMTLGSVFVKNGVAIIIIVIISAAIGFISTGQLAQLLLRKKDVS